MKKSLRFVLLIPGGMILFLLLSWLTFYFLVTKHQDSIIERAISQIQKEIKGTVHIGQMDFHFFKTFPSLTICLSDVTLQDSLWDLHHHELFSAQNIYARLSLGSLIRGKPRVNKLILEQAAVYLYKDACGYSNLIRTTPLSKTKGHASLPDISLKNVRLTIQNERTQSFHDFEIKHLKCKNTEKDSFHLLKLDMDMLVHSLSFNQEKGSYAQNKTMQGRFDLRFYAGKKVELDRVKLKIDDHPFLWDGTIYTGIRPVSYDLHIQTRQIHFPKAVSLLTKALQQHFEHIQMQQPLDAAVTVKGHMAYRVIPEVSSQFSLQNVDMDTPIGRLTDCSYSGTFTNFADSLRPTGDENSKFIFSSFTGNWSNMPVTSSRIEISNFNDPLLAGDLQSEFNLEDLNALAGSTTIRFLKGTGRLDVIYNGPIARSDSLITDLNGTIELSNATLNYIPRNLLFTDCNGLMEFRNTDLLIQHLQATIGHSHLSMNGNVINLLALLHLNPEQLTLEWNISTPVLHLGDFVTYIDQRVEYPVNKIPNQNKVIATVENIDRMLHYGTAKLNVSAGLVTYKKFTATRARASVLMTGNNVLLRDVKLHHGGGTLFLQGKLINGVRSSRFDLESSIEHVDIPRLFQAFDNFGQDALTAANMKGTLTAKTKLAGVLTNKATIQENSLKGKVDFVVENGELDRFEPAMKIAETAFRNRDFSKIQFARLENQIAIAGTAIHIQKMEIRSNVVILFVEGVYDTRKGTDMSIQVPLSNLSRAENEILRTPTGRTGINIRLWAKTAEDGTLKVSWDPLNKGGRQRNK